MTRAPAISAELFAAIVDRVPRGENLFVLVDLANVPHEATKLHRSFVHATGCSMLGDAAPSTQIVSPSLMPVDITNPRDRMLALSVDLAQRSSAVSWICSELSLIALSARLRLRTQAKLSDNYDVLLRHFDPRVLPVLHRVLEAHQRDAFFNLGHAWLYLDRESALCEILLTRAPVVEPLAWSLDLNDMQAAALLDAAEIDAVMPQLVNEDPERFIALGNGAARYQFTSHWLERARHWKLEQFPQKVVLCTS